VILRLVSVHPLAQSHVRNLSIRTMVNRRRKETLPESLSTDHPA
jgi:hypothetical protein